MTLHGVTIQYSLHDLLHPEDGEATPL